MSLIPLSRNPDYELPGNTLDVRGWTVRTTVDREKVGKVDDVLIDDQGRMRYLDVDLGMFNKHVLLPLANAHVDRSDDVVWVDGLSKQRFGEIPEYAFDARSLTPAYERRLEEDYRLAATGRSRGTEERVVADRETEGPHGELARLGDLDQYRVASEDADPRGWKVVTGDGEKIGEIDELLVDPVSMEARYLDCDVAEDALELEPLDRHILIPVDRSRLDRTRKRVVVDGIFSRDVASYPVYGGLPLAADSERSIASVYDRAAEPTGGPTGVDNEVEHRFYRMRRGDRQGTAEPDGEMTERRRSESDDVERLDAATLTGPDQEVRIRVSGNDIIIEKRAVD